MRGNQAPFVTRNVRKEIHIRSRFRNKFCKNLTKKMKNCIKNKETNVLPVGGNV